MHHIVPIVILVLVSSIALAAAILAATGHLGEFVNALNEQFSSGNQPDAEESAKLPEKSSDKSLEENTEKSIHQRLSHLKHKRHLRQLHHQVQMII